MKYEIELQSFDEAAVLHRALEEIQRIRQRVLDGAVRADAPGETPAVDPPKPRRRRATQAPVNEADTTDAAPAETDKAEAADVSEADLVAAVTVATTQRGVAMPDIIAFLGRKGVQKIPQLSQPDRAEFIAWLTAGK